LASTASVIGSSWAAAFEHRGELPSETTFSRAFAEFARSALKA